MTTATDTDIRELDHRTTDGIEVKLLWSAESDRIWIDVQDNRAGRSFELEVDPGDALEAFRHPFAFAPAA
ncbi:MAG TPA: hypothetical protein VGF81_03085 [Solirubrobacteraceae bacterium]|jgi:hypothetical protein